MVFRELLGLLFPQRCHLCSAPAHRSPALPLCESCWQSIPQYTGPACRQCGLPAISIHTDICSSCIADPPPFSRMQAYGIYAGALKEAIHLLKFNGRRSLAHPLATLLSGLALPEADVVVPVPLHINQLRQREFNQTALIGRHLAACLKIPLRLDVLFKTRETAPQIEVDRQQRLKNIKKAFSASEAASGQRILLVEDVITTGPTTRECARVLKKAGAQDVNVVALARSMPKY